MSLRFSIIITILSLAIFGFTLKKNKLSDPDKEKVLLEIVKYVVERGHYNSIDLDDISDRLGLSIWEIGDIVSRYKNKVNIIDSK